MLKNKINEENFSITTERLCLLPLGAEYIQEYLEEFNDEITKYQFPDSFKSIEATKKFFKEFIQYRKEGRSLICIITDRGGAFIGSVEAHCIDSTTPELGIWIAQKHHAKGYGYEAIKGMMDYIRANQQIEYFVYEADCRNVGSLKLIQKLKGEKQGYEEFVTESGKELKLDKYYIK